MAERIEDLNLPNSVVARITKEAIPEGINIAKDAKTALAKAASVFVLYITSASNNIAMKNSRKTINGQDVINAMEEVEFGRFVEPLEEALENFKKIQKEKKDAVAKRKLQKRQNDSNMEEGATSGKETNTETSDD